MWTGRQRKRLLDIARSAGLPVDDHTLIDEPIAAGVAWVNNRIAGRGKACRGQLLVFDMGGGTLDVAVLDVHADLGQDPEISVLSSWGVDEAGDVARRAPGGRARASARRARHRPGLTCRTQPPSASVVRQAAKEAKERLSDASTRLSPIRYPGVDLPALSLSREQLDVAFHDQLDRAADLVWAVLRGAQVTHEVTQEPREIRAVPSSHWRARSTTCCSRAACPECPPSRGMTRRHVPSRRDLLRRRRAVRRGHRRRPCGDRCPTNGSTCTVRRSTSCSSTKTRMGRRSARAVYEAHSPFYPPFQPCSAARSTTSGDPGREHFRREASGW